MRGSQGKVTLAPPPPLLRFAAQGRKKESEPPVLSSRDPLRAPHVGPQRLGNED